MTVSRFGIYELLSEKARSVVILSYPGVEMNGAVIVAPLFREDEIAFVSILHPRVETKNGFWLIAMERMAGVSPNALGSQIGSLEKYEYEIQRAHARLFFGN